MSYTNETTHYGIPKPLGTDLTVPMDYNEAADAIDQALFDASTNATEAVTAANNAVEAAAEAVEDVGDLGTEVNSLKGRTSALETSDVIQNNKIDNLENQGVTKFDSAGIADPYVNGLTYSVGDVVTYNGQRYKCITAVVAAEPFDADKWSAEDVETVLNDIKSDLAEVIIGSVQGDGTKTWSQALMALATAFNSVGVTSKKINKLQLIAEHSTNNYTEVHNVIYASTPIASSKTAVFTTSVTTLTAVIVDRFILDVNESTWMRSQVDSGGLSVVDNRNTTLPTDVTLKLIIG